MPEKSAKSFTVVELLVVIAIIGLIVAVVIVTLREAQARARDSERTAEIDTIRKALIFYLTDNNKYPEKTSWTKIEEDAGFAAEMQPYLPIVPSDPLYGQSTVSGKPYSYQYKSVAEGKTYKICAEMETKSVYCVYSTGGEEIAYGGGGPQTINGDIVYVDENDLMWSETSLPSIQRIWGPAGEWVRDCIGHEDDPNYPACYYCAHEIGTSGNYAGYSNWHLPSCESGTTDQSCMIWTLYNECGDCSSWDSNATQYYWSSSEYDPSGAYDIDVNSGGLELAAKDVYSYNVRCARGDNPPNQPTAPNPIDGSNKAGINPTLSVYASDSDRDRTAVTFYNAADNSVIGTDTGVLDGRRASITWSSLTNSQTYSWYTIIGDGTHTTQSPTWQFTTLSAGEVDCTVASYQGSSHIVGGNTVYCDSYSRMWSKTATTTKTWGPNAPFGEFAGECTGHEDDLNYPACYYCANQIGSSGTYAGYSDWHLPSCIDKNNLAGDCVLYQFGMDNCGWNGGNGGQSSCAPAWDSSAVASLYWSSSEYCWSIARRVDFSVGTVWSNAQKSSSYYVRCVRP